MKRNNKKGFTIVELVIVIAVIAILAAVMIPTFSGLVNKAKENQALQEVKNAWTATLADDVDDDATDDINVADVYVHHSNGTIIKVTTGGTASVVESGTATHTLTNGKLVAVTP